MIIVNKSSDVQKNTALEAPVGSFIRGTRPIRSNNNDFRQESHFYVDVLTKGGELCDINEDGTFLIMSDGSDEGSDEDEADHHEN